MKSFFLSLGLSALSLTAFAEWTEFRGPTQDGIATGKLPT